MKLGVDIDGVILDSGLLYNAAFQKRFTLKNANTWDFEEAYDISTEEVSKVLREVEQITDVPLIPGAQILNKIVELPHIESPIHFVSSRALESYDSTKEALGHHFSFFFELWCGGKSKGKFCEEEKIDFFVEDGPPHIQDIYDNSNTQIYVLDKPYNREIDLPDIMRVKNWLEILIDIQREGYREAVRVKNEDVDG